MDSSAAGRRPSNPAIEHGAAEHDLAIGARGKCLHLEESEQRCREKERRQGGQPRFSQAERPNGDGQPDEREPGTHGQRETEGRPVESAAEVHEERRVEALEIEVDELRPIEPRAHGRDDRREQDREPGFPGTGIGDADHPQDHDRIQAHEEAGGRRTRDFAECRDAPAGARPGPWRRVRPKAHE